MESRVELRPAFAWDCPECGREHFSRAIVPEFSNDDLDELRAKHGIQPWETGDFLVAPSRVGCPDCGVEFEASHFCECDDEEG